jgi:hypothetical protein
VSPNECGFSGWGRFFRLSRGSQVLVPSRLFRVVNQYFLAMSFVFNVKWRAHTFAGGSGAFWGVWEVGESAKNSK